MTAEPFQKLPNSPQKTALIQDLEYGGWITTDTFYDFDMRAEYRKTDIGPFIDETGEVVFLVTETGPSFPGGADVQSDYFKNFLDDLLVKPGEATQHTMLVQFLVLPNGQIAEVSSARTIDSWIPETSVQCCIHAVRDMPAWSPGLHRGRPVKVKMLLTFSLRT